MEKVLEAHTRKINDFEHPVEDEIWSCSDDGLVVAWSISKRCKIASMDVNSGSIRCIRQINSKIWAGSSNNSIICWSVEVCIILFHIYIFIKTLFLKKNKEAVQELEISDSVMCIEKVGTSVWTGTADNQLLIMPHAAKL